MNTKTKNSSIPQVPVGPIGVSDETDSPSTMNDIPAPDVTDADQLLNSNTNNSLRPVSNFDNNHQDSESGFNATLPANNNQPQPTFGPTGINNPVNASGVAGPDFYIYQQRKTIAQGMMDLALFSANANQLRYVFESNDRHPFFYPSVICIIISLFLQIAVGVGLILNGRCTLSNEKQINFANRVNNFTVLGIFIVTIVNVFISAFGVADAPSPTVMINNNN